MPNSLMNRDIPFHALDTEAPAFQPVRRAMDRPEVPLFETAVERDAYFRRISREPTAVAYGSAMNHAAGTYLGIWGKRDALMRDCATLMAAEVCRYLIEQPQTGDDCFKRVSPETVLVSKAFQSAFARARGEQEAAVHNWVRSLGDNAAHMERMVPDAAPERELHARIAEEIRWMVF